MGYTVLAFSEHGFEEYPLPDLDNSDHELILHREVFQLDDTIHVPLEVVDGVWSFLEQTSYTLKTGNINKNGFGVGLTDGAIFELSKKSIKITFVISQKVSNYPIFDKYTLRYLNQINIGKLETNTIVYDFMSFISKTHAIIYKYDNRWLVRDESRNGTFLNGRRINGQEYLKFGDSIIIFGLKIIFLGEIIAVAAITGEYENKDINLQAIHPRERLVIERDNLEKEEKVYFKRAPRTIEKVYTEPIEIEPPPPLNESKKRPLLMTIGPSFTMAIPMSMGVMMSIIAAKSRGQSSGAFMFTGLVTAISSAFIGVMWGLINLKYTKKEEKENEELRFNSYSQYLIDITNQIKEKYEYNSRVMKSNYHSGAECCAQAGFNDTGLWNRNVRQPDFLRVRVGVGTTAFQAPIQAPKAKFSLKHDELAEKPTAIQEAYSKLYRVPACMDLLDAKVIGIIGGPQKAAAYPIAYNIIAQLAANNCYTDVKMVFIYKHSDLENKWDFARWLPHVWMEDKKTRLIADNKEDLGDILFELSNMLRRRTEDRQDKDDIPLPHYVIFIDDQELLEGEILEKTLYNPVAAYGITTFILAEKYADLPNSCEEIIQNEPGKVKMFNVYDEEKYSTDLEVESVTELDLERLARKLCNIEVNETVETGEIPDSLDFFDMFGVRSMEELHVIDRWRKNRNYETMRVPIGMKNGGNICYLDVHEKYHGPHGLVAGTTGSGKSETLQTYILALAVNFSPDDIAFFIIDFKGGGMANLFTDLPHMAGQISNLSGNQVRRAMISIKSENKRRQRVFAENNVNNINLYTRLYKNHEATLPVPHLFIIIDEFAELKREEPEFMKELISVAQVGRSLGVHLILATQKPSGTVDENIWSNSKFRLCLRVQDKQDSNDMLHRPDAAYITQAGRGYLQVGNDEIFEQFQSGYSGADYVDDPNASRGSVAELIKLNGKTMVSGGSVRKHKEVEKDKAMTQLEAVIAYLNKLASVSQYNKKMLLWRPVLGEKIYLADLKGYSDDLYHDGVWRDNGGEFDMRVPIGLYDDPANQDQRTLYVDFKDGGNLAVCGLIGVGKSTFLQSLLWSLIQHYSPEELNFYVFDYSSRMLLPFENAPHCGGVVIDTDDDKVNKFFFMITRIIDERKSLFKGANYSQYIRANRDKKLPAILIVVDNVANFREKTNNIYDDILLRLSREGISYGIYLVLTAAGYGSSEIPTRLGDNIKSVICLEMGDKFKYTELFHTTASVIQILPEANVKGRGLTSVQGAFLEFQTALVSNIEDAYEQSAMIEGVCKEMCDKYQGARAKRIPVIPEKPVFTDIEQLEEYQNALKDTRYLPCAYQSKDASIYSVDLWNTYCYLVQGKAKTGKSNFMYLLLYAACKQENAKVYVIDDSSASMKDRAQKLGATVFSTAAEVFDFFSSTVPMVKERSLKKKAFVDQGLEPAEVAEKMSGEEKMFIFIADLVAFVKDAGTAVEGKGKIQGYIENITEKGSNLGMHFIGCANTDDAVAVNGNRIYQNFVSYKAGVHLGGNVAAQRVFQFTNIPYQEGTKVTKPGVGLVPSNEDYLKADSIVIPLVKGSLT